LRPRVTGRQHREPGGGEAGTPEPCQDGRRHCAGPAPALSVDRDRDASGKIVEQRRRGCVRTVAEEKHRPLDHVLLGKAQLGIEGLASNPGQPPFERDAVLALAEHVDHVREQLCDRDRVGQRGVKSPCRADHGDAAGHAR